MSRRLAFMPEAWEDYVYRQTQDKKTLRRVNQLLHDIQRNPFEGIGKPEPLKGHFAGLWSRRVDDANRLVYRVSESTIEVVQCRCHYGQE